MKKILLVSLLVLSTVLLASCGWEAPLTEAQQAEKYNMTTTEYKEMKDAAARMNMTVEDHMKMTDTEHENMDMSDDSHMIEDDMEKNDNDKHMDAMNKWEDVDSHSSDGHM